MVVLALGQIVAVEVPVIDLILLTSMDAEQVAPESFVPILGAETLEVRT
jgi:hypothetical protein